MTRYWISGASFVALAIAAVPALAQDAQRRMDVTPYICLLYTSDAADE